MFDTLLIIAYLVLTSFTSYLFTYFKFEHQYKTFVSLFSFITDINGFFEIRTPLPPDPPFIKFNKNLRHPPVYFAPKRLISS